MCYLLPQDYVRELLDNNMIIEAVRGGLVVGRRHSAGGIKMMQIVNSQVWAIGEMEGGEYLVNCFSSDYYHNRLKEINDYNAGEVEDLPDDVVSGVRHYIVPPDHWIMLSAAPCSIINRSATKAYLSELDALNDSFLDCFGKEN